MKMKKKILSAAVLAALGGGTAQAVNLSTDHLGQVILFPYYTVQGNESTYLQVINTKGVGKAVKIRFREAFNSREVLDFNIYLSPYDVWTGEVFLSGEGAAIRTKDTTCTVPKLPAFPAGQPFRTLAYTGANDDTNGNLTDPEGNPVSALQRTREGYVEIIEMGEIYDTVAPVDADSDGHADYHHIAGVPENCDTLVAAWRAGGAWASDSSTGITAPGGGLFGTLSIINVSTGTQVSVNATALANVYQAQQHHNPGSTLPTLANAGSTSDVLINYGSPMLFTDIWAPSGGYAGINAVSAVLMARSVINSYSVNPVNNAESAWIVTFPTKWMYTDQAFTPSVWAVRPFTDTFQDPPLPRSSWDNKACEEIELELWDREEKKVVDDDIDFSPRPPTPRKSLCYEVNVLQFGDSSVFDASNTKFSVTGMPGNKGWMRMTFANPNHMMGVGAYSQNLADTRYFGLPVIGFKAKVLGNAAFEGKGSYASAVEHAYERGVLRSLIILD